MSASCSVWRSPAWPATMPTGIACSISAASPTRSSAMPMASITRRMFNDRLLLGLKGTMSEAELHILRARLLGGIRNKAARGELRRGLPVGFVWGEEDGEVRFHPDEAVTARHPHRLRALRRTRIGAPRLAVAAQRGPVVPDADPLWRPRSAGSTRATSPSIMC